MRTRTLVSLTSIIYIIASFNASNAQSQTQNSTVSYAPITINNCVVQQNGKNYHGIGMNYTDAFTNFLLSPNNVSYKAGFADLNNHKIPFIRFQLMPFYPVQANAFVANPNLLFQQLDIFVKDAETNNIGLIPSVYFNYTVLPDVFGEPISAWGNPLSKTRVFASGFATQLAARYKNSTAIWAWEFTNEFNDWADVPNGYMYMPVAPSGGTPAARTTADNITSTQLNSAYAAFAQSIAMGDPTRIVVSGYDVPRNNAYNLQRGSWTIDTQAQYQAVSYSQQSAGNMTTFHIYPGSVTASYSARFLNNNVTTEQFISVAATVGNTNCRPTFVGEFGVADDGTQGTPQASFTEFQNMANTIVSSGTPLAAAWVYNFAWQDGKNGNYSITSTNAHQNRYNLITQINAALQKMDGR